MRICAAAGSGGIGGTQKAAALFARELARRGHAVDYLTRDEGPWTERCRDAGVSVRIMDGSPAAFRSYIEQASPDVIHQHVSGSDPDHPLYAALSQTAPGKRPHLIETNVFGRLEDPEGDRWVEFRLFVALTGAIQALRRAGKTLTRGDLARMSVLYNPVETPAPITVEARAAFRKELGFGPDDIIAVRVGRPDRAKWTDWECRAFAIARRERPELRLVLMEPPADLADDAGSGRFGPSITVLPAASDQSWIDRLYQSCDVMVHAAYSGESFGYTLAEAMMASLPIVVRTTPYGDNAQVELVESGETGFVCGGVPEMARRLVDLSADAELRARLGAAGRERITEMVSLDRETDLLEAVLSAVTTGERTAVIARREDRIMAYAAEFDSRQWRLSEPASSHPLDYAAARLYSAMRPIRSRIKRAVLGALRGTR